MGFTKITSDDTTGKGVVGLPDTPNLSTTEMQQKFDELATDVIIPKFNNLVDELDEKNIDSKVGSDAITNIALNEDNNIVVSTDGGKTYKQTSSSGHIIMDGTGRSFPQRSRMQYSANAVISDVPADNTTFIQIPSGTKGDKGDSATIKVGSVQTSPTPYVNNVGSQYDAIFDFGIPKGQDGNSATIQVGTVTQGNNASVSNRGTSSNAIFDFVLPKGDKGDAGTSFQVLGMYPTYADLIAAHPTGNRGDAYSVGDSTTNEIYNWDNDQRIWVNLGGLKGVKGDDGLAATISIGTVTDSPIPSVENVGTAENAILNFGLQKGDKGDPGNAATIAVGTVTRGENAEVTNVGTSTNAVFDFTIPKGDKGDPGAPSIVNGKSGDSIVLYGYDMFLKNYAKPSQYSEITDDDSIQSAIGKLESRNSGGSKIIVETDSDSIGNTFTLSNGVKTLSQIADDSMRMEFFVDDIGVWTVTNVEADNSTTIDIKCYSVYNVVLGVGNIGITVNYDAEYVDSTFTITNGTKSITKTATSSLSVAFVVADLGEWTVSNSYDSVTKKINVTTEGDYSVTFSISHVKSYTEWLSLAGISKTFTSLEEVLEDQPTVRELFTRHASVDYLVANESDTENITTILNAYYSMKWINLRDYALDKLSEVASIKAIMDEVGFYGYGEVTKDTEGNIILKGLVPTMTSNNAPYGTASASTSYDTARSAYIAFSGGSGTGYWNGTKGSGDWIQYEFVNPVCVSKINLLNISSHIMTQFKLQGSNDGTTFKDLGIFNNNVGANNLFSSDVSNNDYFKIYRVTCITSSTTQTGVKTLQFYGRSLSVSVPKMDGNNSPWGEVSIANRSEITFNTSQYEPYLAFLNNDGGSTNGAFTFKGNKGSIVYDYKNPCVAKVLSFGSIEDTTKWRFEKAIFYGSNSIDNGWEELGTINKPSSLSGYTNGRIYAFRIPTNNNTPYRYYKVDVYGSTSYWVNVACVNFYGLDYSEHEERHWIYDHGVEVETITAQNSSVTKRESDILCQSASSSDIAMFYTNKIDISKYNLLRATIGKIGVDRTFILVLKGDAPIQWNTSTWEGYLDKSFPFNPYNDVFLNIININDNKSIAFGCGHDASRKTSCEALWLE